MVQIKVDRSGLAVLHKRAVAEAAQSPIAAVLEQSIRNNDLARLGEALVIGRRTLAEHEGETKNFAELIHASAWILTLREKINAAKSQEDWHGVLVLCDADSIPLRVNLEEISETRKMAHTRLARFALEDILFRADEPLLKAHEEDLRLDPQPYEEAARRRGADGNVDLKAKALQMAAICRAWQRQDWGTIAAYEINHLPAARRAIARARRRLLADELYAEMKKVIQSSALQQENKETQIIMRQRVMTQLAEERSASCDQVEDSEARRVLTSMLEVWLCLAELAQALLEKSSRPESAAAAIYERILREVRWRPALGLACDKCSELKRWLEFVATHLEMSRVIQRLAETSIECGGDLASAQLQRSKLVFGSLEPPLGLDDRANLGFLHIEVIIPRGCLFLKEEFETLRFEGLVLCTARAAFATGDADTLTQLTIELRRILNAKQKSNPWTVALARELNFFRLALAFQHALSEWRAATAEGIAVRDAADALRLGSTTAERLDRLCKLLYCLTTNGYGKTLRNESPSILLLASQALLRLRQAQLDVADVDDLELAQEIDSWGLVSSDRDRGKQMLKATRDALAVVAAGGRLAWRAKTEILAAAQECRDRAIRRALAPGFKRALTTLHLPLTGTDLTKAAKTLRESSVTAANILPDLDAGNSSHYCMRLLDASKSIALAFDSIAVLEASLAPLCTNNGTLVNNLFAATSPLVIENEFIHDKDYFAHIRAKPDYPPIVDPAREGRPLWYHLQSRLELAGAVLHVVGCCQHGLFGPPEATDVSEARPAELGRRLDRACAAMLKVENIDALTLPRSALSFLLCAAYRLRHLRAALVVSRRRAAADPPKALRAMAAVYEHAMTGDNDDTEFCNESSDIQPFLYTDYESKLVLLRVINEDRYDWSTLDKVMPEAQLVHQHINFIRDIGKLQAVLNVGSFQMLDTIYPDKRQLALHNFRLDDLRKALEVASGHSADRATRSLLFLGRCILDLRRAQRAERWEKADDQQEDVDLFIETCGDIDALSIRHNEAARSVREVLGRLEEWTYLSGHSLAAIALTGGFLTDVTLPEVAQNIVDELDWARLVLEERRVRSMLLTCLQTETGGISDQVCTQDAPVEAQYIQRLLTASFHYPSGVSARVSRHGQREHDDRLLAFALYQQHEEHELDGHLILPPVCLPRDRDLIKIGTEEFSYEAIDEDLRERLSLGVLLQGRWFWAPALDDKLNKLSVAQLSPATIELIQQVRLISRLRAALASPTHRWVALVEAFRTKDAAAQFAQDAPLLKAASVAEIADSTALSLEQLHSMTFDNMPKLRPPDGYCDKVERRLYRSLPSLDDPEHSDANLDLRQCQPEVVHEIARAAAYLCHHTFVDAVLHVVQTRADDVDECVRVAALLCGKNIEFPIEIREDSLLQVYLTKLEEMLSYAAFLPSFQPRLDRTVRVGLALRYHILIRLTARAGDIQAALRFADFGVKMCSGSSADEVIQFLHADILARAIDLDRAVVLNTLWKATCDCEYWLPRFVESARVQPPPKSALRLRHIRGTDFHYVDDREYIDARYKAADDSDKTSPLDDDEWTALQTEEWSMQLVTMRAAIARSQTRSYFTEDSLLLDRAIRTTQAALALHVALGLDDAEIIDYILRQRSKDDIIDPEPLANQSAYALDLLGRRKALVLLRDAMRTAPLYEVVHDSTLWRASLIADVRIDSRLREAVSFASTTFFLRPLARRAVTPRQFQLFEAARCVARWRDALGIQNWTATAKILHTLSNEERAALKRFASDEYDLISRSLQHRDAIAQIVNEYADLINDSFQHDDISAREESIFLYPATNTFESTSSDKPNSEIQRLRAILHLVRDLYDNPVDVNIRHSILCRAKANGVFFTLNIEPAMASEKKDELGIVSVLVDARERIRAVANDTAHALAFRELRSALETCDSMALDCATARAVAIPRPTHLMTRLIDAAVACRHHLSSHIKTTS